MFVVEVFGDTYHVFREPLRKALVAHALRHEARNRRSVWKHAFIVGLAHVFGDEAPFGVGAARVLNGRVHVDRERVPHPSDLDVLVEAVLAGVLRQNADVALAVGDLVVAGRVVSHVGV